MNRVPIATRIRHSWVKARKSYRLREQIPRLEDNEHRLWTLSALRISLSKKASASLPKRISGVRETLGRKRNQLERIDR